MLIDQIEKKYANGASLALIFHRSLFQILARIGDGVLFLRKLRHGRRGAVDRLIGRGGLPGVIVGSPGGG